MVCARLYVCVCVYMLVVARGADIWCLPQLHSTLLRHGLLLNLELTIQLGWLVIELQQSSCLSLLIFFKQNNVISM